MNNGLLFTFNKISLRILLFQVFKNKKMSEYLTVKYFFTSDFTKEPYQVSKEAAGYDFFASEAMTILPKSRQCVKIDLKLTIPEGFYGKVFPPSGLLRDHFVTFDAGVIDEDYRGAVETIMINYHPDKCYSIRTADRICQIVFMRKFNVKFEEGSEPTLLARTKPGYGGFCSAGTNKPIKKESDELKSEDDVVIESVIMSVNDEIIIDSESDNSKIEIIE